MPKIANILTIFLFVNLPLFAVFSQDSNDQFSRKFLENGHTVVDSVFLEITENKSKWAKDEVFMFLVEAFFMRVIEGRKPKEINYQKVNLLTDNHKSLLNSLTEFYLTENLSDKYRTEIETIHKSRPGIYLEATTALLLAEYFRSNNQIEEASVYYGKALNRSKHSSFKSLGIIVQILQSYYYYDKELYERAFTFAQKGLLEAQVINSNYWQTCAKLMLSNIQITLLNFDEAFRILNEIDLDFFNLQHPILQAKREIYLGQYYSNKSDVTNAKSYYNNALIKLHRIDDNLKVGKTYLLLAEELLNQDLIVLAKENFHLSLLYLNDDTSSIARAYFGLGRLHNALNEFKQASNYFEKVNPLISIEEKEKINYYYELAETYKGLKDYKKSIEFYKKHISVKDSVQFFELTAKINELNSLFQTEQKERKILKQEQRIQEKEDKILLNKQELDNVKLRTRFLILSVIFLILFFGVIISLILIRNKQIKLQQRHKSSELKQAILRLQMNPHFIFNSFTVIQSFIYEKDQQSSSKFLVDFSRLLRLILEKSAEEKISLKDELEILERYLEVQKMRFKERFSYSLSVNDNLKDEIETLLIPPLLCQPFVENSIEHGQLDKVKNGMISVKFSKLEEKWIEIVIQDNGVGIDSKQKKDKQNEKNSLALKISDKRIQLINEQSKTKASIQIFDLKEINQKGTRVVIKVPLMKEE